MEVENNKKALNKDRLWRHASSRIVPGSCDHRRLKRISLRNSYKEEAYYHNMLCTRSFIAVQNHMEDRYYNE